MNATPSYLLVVALQATVIVVTALVLMQCALRRPALRHALGVMGLGLLLASPLLALMLPQPGWMTTSQPTSAPAAESWNSSAAPLTTEFDSSQFDEWASPEPTSFDRSDVAVVPPVDVGVPAPQSEPVPEALEAAETAPTWSERWTATRSGVMDQLPFLLMSVGVVWIVGAVWQLVGWRRSYERLRPLRESLTDWPADRPIYDAGGICEELGVRELPPVKVSEIAPMPLVLGIVGPVVVLPRGFVESTAPGRLRDVVLHEAAHIVRRDPLVFVVQRVVGAMFWWNPGVHWLNRAINRAREEVCDNHVLRHGDAATYAELLVELVESYAGLRMELSLMGLLTSRWSLEQRIAGLLHPQRDTRTRAGRVPAIVAAVLLVMVSVIVGGTGALGRFTDRAEAELDLPAADIGQPGSLDELRRSVVAPAEGVFRPRAVDRADAEDVDNVDRLFAEVGQSVKAADESPPPEMRKVTLRGTCEDENQRPLAGVRVQVFRSATRLDPPERVAETVTGDDGRFVLEGIESNPEFMKTAGIGDLFVAANADRLATAGSYVRDKGEQVELTLMLHSNPGTLSGTVRDSKGQPVAGATVYLPTAFSQPMPGIMSAVTDEQGRYAINDLKCWKPADTQTFDPKTKTGTMVSACNFYVRHPDYAVTMAQNTAVPQVVDVTLNPPAVITGQVIDTVTGQPAASVIVSAQGVARYGWGQTRTDADGRYTLRLTKDHYNIWAEMPERMPIAVKTLEAVSGKTAEGADIRMVRGGFVVGTLIDPATNEPYKPAEGQDLTVGHYGPARPRTGAAVTLAVVQPDGTFRLRVAPGRNYVYLMSGGTSGTYIDVEDGQEVRHDFRIGEHVATDATADDPDVQLSSRLQLQARDEDERRAASLPPPPARRERGDSAAGKLLDRLQSQNAGTELFGDAWLRTLKQIVDLGPDAVPELIAELDATQNEMMLRCLGFSLRAIGDKRAVPGLIRAIPKTLLPPRSDMGLRSDDEELARFAQRHDLDSNDSGNEYAFGRPVREVFGALRHLTGQKFDEEELYFVQLRGQPRQKRLQRKLYEECSRRWTDWWEQHWSEHVSDAEYARVRLPESMDSVAEVAAVREPRYKSGEGYPGRVMESALSAKPGRQELLDLDTGRAGAVPAQWRKTIGGDGHAQFVAWATEHGYDLLGYEYEDPGSGRRVHAIRPLSGHFWELDDSHWKKSYDEVTLPALREQGRRVQNHWLLHFDSQAGAVEALARATFLFETSDGTPGLLYVGVDVQDDTQKPGVRVEGDSELQPVGFWKGRQFGYTFLDPIAEPAVRAANAVEAAAPAASSSSSSDFKPVAAPVQWGTIEGQFVFDGEAPVVPPLKTAQGEVPDESLLVNAGNKGIANVCIYLERAPGQIHPELSKSRSETVAFDSRKLQFVPHILVARTDQSILLKNSNAGPLNVRPMLHANPAINQVIGPNDSTGAGFGLKRSELKHPPLQVSSDLQSWMRAYWIVSDHPYVAVTDADGKFRIENLPAGEHTFRVWHERAGFMNPVAYQRDLKVNVEADKTVTLPVFKMPAGELEK